MSFENGKWQNIEETTKLIRELALEYKMSEASVKRAIETSARNVFLKKGKVITLFVAESRTIFGFDLAKRQNREWTLSNSDYKLIAEETRKELVKKFQKNLSRKEEKLYNNKNKLLESLIKTELRDSRVVRAVIVGITEDKKRVVLKFRKKDGEIKEEPQFFVSIHNFLKTDQLKLGNVFSLWVSEAIFDKKVKKLIGFKATRKSNAVFDDEFSSIFKAMLHQFKNNNVYTDDQIAFISKSLISKKNYGGNMICKVRGDSIGLIKGFYSEMGVRYKKRLSRNLVYEITKE